MTERFKLWWSLRTTREQRMLLAMGAAVAIFLLWIGIVRPIDHALTRARERHAQAALDLAMLSSQRDDIRRLQRMNPDNSNTPVEERINQTAQEDGVTLTHVTPEPPSAATVAIDAVRSQALFGWVTDLETKRGVIVDKLAVHPNSDATLGAELRLRLRGR